ncbi:MAG TPA: hypothetical protein QF446_06535, partial [Planctomycetota bacterium]|nr:hypothetical protein [Planctomycetota bacterium]
RKPPTGRLLKSGNSGSFSFRPDLTNLPGGVLVQSGETWHFQAWYRDGTTSNLSDGITVMFR